MMSNAEIGAYAILADAFQYPFSGLATALQAQIQELPQGSSRQALQAFLDAAQRLSLGDWEELYTRTLDLNPAVAPYIGYQLWGDSYARGNFMAALNRAYQAAGMKVNGELPDHLGVILTYLATGAAPLPELEEAFASALQKMLTTLSKAEADNPYTLLLKAVMHSVDLSAVQNLSFTGE